MKYRVDPHTCRLSLLISVKAFRDHELRFEGQVTYEIGFEGQAIYETKNLFGCFFLFFFFREACLFTLGEIKRNEIHSFLYKIHAHLNDCLFGCSIFLCL